MGISGSGPTGSRSASCSGVRPAWAWTYGVQVPYTWILLMPKSRKTLAKVLAEGKGGIVDLIWTRVILR